MCQATNQAKIIVNVLVLCCFAASVLSVGLILLKKHKASKSQHVFKWAFFVCLFCSCGALVSAIGLGFVFCLLFVL
jgi:hypothetical protein